MHFITLTRSSDMRPIRINFSNVRTYMWNKTKRATVIDMVGSVCHQVTQTPDQIDAELKYINHS